MSDEAELWLGSIERKYGAGPGTPAVCVQYADCPHCNAKAGQLCQSDAGSPTLGHHWRRGTAYTHLRRSGHVPTSKAPTHVRLKELEARLCVVESALLEKTQPKGKVT